MQLLGKILYKGQQREVWWEDGRRKLEFKSGKFWISRAVAEDQDLFSKEYDAFCKIELAKIIDRQLARLRGKKIDVELEYGNAESKETFWKTIQTSVDDFLKENGFSPKIEYEIGNYEREWGVNQISPKDKRFTLLFNLNLIKFDDGTHIEYVVAHELAHVFHRDHEQRFQKTLQNLYPKKNQSETFFDHGIGSLLGISRKIPLAFVLGLLALVAIYWLFNLLQGSVTLFRPASQF